MTRHATDAISLAFGIAFLAFVGWWLLLRAVTVDPPGFGWFVGGAFVALGAFGAYRALRAGVRHTRDDTG
jgi:hypothetical protein